MAKEKIDEGLIGNEKIEQAIAGLQQEATPEQLAHTLTVIRRRMQEGGQVIVAVEARCCCRQLRQRAGHGGQPSAALKKN